MEELTVQDAVVASLERVAEQVGDPAPLVYEHLFAEHPDMLPLFVRDSAGLVRGEMLRVVLECVLDFAAGGNTYAANLMRSERINHQNLGVPPEVFDTFFDAVITVFRGVLGAEWTPEVDEAWRHTTQAMLQEIRSPA